MQLAHSGECSFHLMHHASNVYCWFFRDLLVSRPVASRPRLSNPSSGSGVAVSGRCSVLSGALALALIGALAVSVEVRSAMAGALVVAVGVVSTAAGALVVAVGVVSIAAGVLVVAVGALAIALAQCWEIIFSPVTTTLLSEEPEPVAAFVFCPMTSTSWPTCGFRSTALLVILKV